MKTLHIIASPRGERSKSKELGIFASEKLSWDIITLDLNQLEIPYLTNNVITYNYGFMKYEDLPETDKKIVEIQSKLIQQLKSVDNVVVSAPLWNFGMPAILKGYLDLVVKVGETFGANENGLFGMVTNVQKLIIITTKGSVYKGTAWESVETIEKNIQQAFAFMGVTQVQSFVLEGATQKDEATLNADIENLKNTIQQSL